jgi:adenylate cyclase
LNATLKITDPTGRTWQVPLDPRSATTIGRSRNNRIVLGDRRVSRNHAYIYFNGADFLLVDGSMEDGRLVRSVNHVFVNGVVKLAAALRPGDVITIGESQLTFEEEVSVPATELPPISPPDAVNFEDSPMGLTQVRMSVREIIGEKPNLTDTSDTATPEEIRDLRRRSNILGILFEMSRSFGTIFDLDEIFDRATDLIFRGTPADRVVALLAEERPDGTVDPASLFQVGVRTRDESLAKHTEKLAVSRTITQKVMNEGVAILSQDISSDEQFMGVESIVSQGVRSTICAPLITSANIHGVLYADRLDPFATFRNDHLELISAVAARTAATVETVKAHKRLAREELARANYSRFMPEYVVKQMLENPGSFRLGGVNQTITVLFSDIRGFTALSETENPEVIVGLLNRYFSAMTEVIFKHGGTLDKFLGDGIMALFGAPTATPDDAANAVKAAAEMQTRLLDLNSELEAEGQKPIAIGIGLHTGVATVGYIGSDARSEYTAIGDTVNLASRLESNTVGGQILISDATAIASHSVMPLVKRDPIVVKNRKQPVGIFEVIWG